MTRKPPITHTERTPERALTLVASRTNSDPTPRRYRLGTMGGIRRELGAVYKAAREGELNLQDACRLGYLLATLAKVSEGELLEGRLQKLEETAAERQHE